MVETLIGAETYSEGLKEAALLLVALVVGHHRCSFHAPFRFDVSLPRDPSSCVRAIFVLNVSSDRDPSTTFSPTGPKNYARADPVLCAIVQGVSKASNRDTLLTL